MSKVNYKAFRAVRKTRVSEKIIEQVRDLITSGRLQPGDRLPAERELAETLQAGRSTVREAIRALESLGLLEVRAGQGTFLAARSQSPESHPLTAGLLKSWDDQHQLFEVRQVIEPDLAALAARRATGDQIKKMWAPWATRRPRSGEAKPGFTRTLASISCSPRPRRTRSSSESCTA